MGTAFGDKFVQSGRDDGVMDLSLLFRGLPVGSWESLRQGHLVDGRIVVQTHDGPVGIAGAQGLDVHKGLVVVSRDGCEWVMFARPPQEPKADEQSDECRLPQRADAENRILASQAATSC